MAAPIDIQAKLDELLAGNPDVQQYITKVWYVPEGQPVPPDVTQIVTVASVTSADRVLRLGVVMVPKYAALIDMLLAMVVTQPKP